MEPAYSWLILEWKRDGERKLKIRCLNLKVMWKANNYFFFSIWIFCYDHSRITGLKGKGEGIFLTPHYHFHPLHRHLDITRAITAERSPLHIASSRTWIGNLLVSKRKFLTTKLRALKLLPNFYLTNTEISTKAEQ